MNRSSTLRTSSLLDLSLHRSSHGSNPSFRLYGRAAANADVKIAPRRSTCSVRQMPLPVRNLATSQHHQMSRVMSYLHASARNCTQNEHTKILGLDGH